MLKYYQGQEVKKMNENKENVLNKSVINWDIEQYVKLLANPYK